MGNSLKKYYVFDTVNHEQIKNTVIIVDGNIWLNQAVSTYRTAEGELFTNKKGVITSHIYGLFYKLVPLITSGNRIIFCVDGPRLAQKKENTKERGIQREKHRALLENLKKCLDITKEEIKMAAKRILEIHPEMFDTTEHLLYYLGIPMIRSAHEAESQCVKIQEDLLRNGVKSYIMTPDSDTFVFGGDWVIMSSTKKDYQILNKAKTIEAIGLSLEQIVDVVLLSGGDYSPGVSGVGPINALKLIKRHGRLLSIPDSEFRTSSADSFKKLKDGYDTLFNLYSKPPVNEYSLEHSELDLEGLELFLVEELNFSRRLLVPLANHFL
jgi:flap endonuclease-1